MPKVFTGNHQAQSYFGILKMELPEAFVVQEQQSLDKWINLAFEIDGIVSASVAENSINLQNLKADISQKLLAKIFAECKAMGAGMEQAKEIVGKVVQSAVTRVSRIQNG